eukprot:CAMPEP_0202751778 /NCGR_PEP_ID=MMETSP1388-20130828/12338_1 /ASSEMBLY_ACC=CAM_ASM_000864 /TAXON_ID=37098 /ORGANISM="Isochrysis sp, Strain CCMP1244" /LENGTH=71 /DNA_ID=CAMNT_0049419441 /DNA_START=1 /DNA_END=212 /DNA_ORIENTATION=-
MVKIVMAPLGWMRRHRGARRRANAADALGCVESAESGTRDVKPSVTASVHSREAVSRVPSAIPGHSLHMPP